MKTHSLLLLSLLLILPSEAQAQSSVQICDRGSPSDCAQVTNGALDVNATVSTTASVTGWPGSTQTTGTPLAVTTASGAASLPAGTVVVLTNDDTTNTAFCKLGATATVNDTPIYPHSSVSFTVGSATQFACITSTSTATVKSSGGAGLPTGWGGGSAAGGGGGGSVTQGTTPWIVAGGGTAGTAATGVVTIQGITSMTPVQVSQATAGNLNATIVGTGTFATQSAITAASGAFASGSIASGAYATGSIGSGAVASGAIASGAVASGAFASGSIASGAYAAGAIGSGAIVDLGAIADAAATAGSTGSVNAKLRLMTTQLVGLTLAQGSTTSGQVGNLAMGAVTTAAPSYTTAQSSPLSLDTTGALRVNVTAGGAGGGAITAASGSYASGAISSGAIASGAIASGAVASGAFAAGSISDGADVALGSKADAAAGTGTVSAIAILKQIHLDINTPPALGTTGGWTPVKLAALTNTAVSIKASPGQVGKVYCSNTHATNWAYIQIFNLGSGSVTVGTTVPAAFYGIPPASAGGYTLSLVGDQFSTAISVAATSTATGASAPTTAMDCVVSYN